MPSSGLECAGNGNEGIFISVGYCSRGDYSELSAHVKDGWRYLVLHRETFCRLLAALLLIQ